jgi:hypothetical protein
MAYALRNGLSYCKVEGHDVFLDLQADHYFQLATGAEASFRKLCAEPELPACELGSLSALGLLRSASSQDGLLPAWAEIPTELSPHLASHQGAMLAALRALLCQMRIERYLKKRGLAASMTRLRRQKEQLPYVAQGGLVYGDWVRGFEHAKLLRSPAKRCLPRSMALASCLFQAGFGVQLVIGVRLRPFSAHCWVQDGVTVLNDTPEDVAIFTPIFVL